MNPKRKEKVVKKTKIDSSPSQQPATDPFTLYMREMGTEPLLTPSEEKELARRIRDGDEKARERMIKANLRLVVKIARIYEGLGMPLLDLINEGNIGLMKAVERFDPAKGGKLSTYGSWWIKQSIRRALADQARTIRLPVHLIDMIARMRRVALKLQEELGREPTSAELAEEMNISEVTVEKLRTASMPAVSVEAHFRSDDGEADTALDLPDDGVLTPYDALVRKTTIEGLTDLFRVLNQREITILTYRFALKGGEAQTLEKVGLQFGVTRERIRQIQQGALEKLKNRSNLMEKSRVFNGRACRYSTAFKAHA